MKKKSTLAWIWDFVSLHKIYFVLSLIGMGGSSLDWLLGLSRYFHHAVAYGYF